MKSETAVPGNRGRRFFTIENSDAAFRVHGYRMACRTAPAAGCLSREWSRGRPNLDEAGFDRATQRLATRHPAAFAGWRSDNVLLQSFVRVRTATEANMRRMSSRFVIGEVQLHFGRESSGGRAEWIGTQLLSGSHLAEIKGEPGILHGLDRIRQRGLDGML